MPAQTVNLDKVEKQLAELLAFAEHNGEIVIAQNGEPLARLEFVKQPKKRKRIAGLNSGKIWTSKDFDESLPDEFWLGKE